MVTPRLASWQTKNHYRSDGDVVYGVYQGCGFSVSEEDDGGLLFIFMLTPRDDDAFDDLEDALADDGGDIAEAQVGDVEGYLALFFDQSSGSVSPRTMDGVLGFVADQARACGFRVPNTCVKCGARATKRSFVDGMVQPLCADCSEENRRQHRAAASKPEKRPAPAPMTDEDERYTAQYTPIVADDSKYDDSYDEYAGMATDESRYRTTQYPPRSRQEDNNPSPMPRFDATPIAFNDDGEEEYRELVGETGEHSATRRETHINGSAAMGFVGAFLGAAAGVIPYIIVALGLKFPMAALCFPAGMMAVWCYTLLKGRKSMVFGMSVSIGVSALLSFVTMWLCMTVFNMNQSRSFGAAMSYLFSEQMTFFVFNTIFAILGAAFGALFMIVVMAKYIGDED